MGADIGRAVGGFTVSEAGVVEALIAAEGVCGVEADATTEAACAEEGDPVPIPAPAPRLKPVATDTGR